VPRVGRRGSRGRVPGTERPENFIFAKGLNTDGPSHGKRTAFTRVTLSYFTYSGFTLPGKHWTRPTNLRSHRETRDRHEDRIFLLKKI
jgi:hypothetical protein